MSWCPKEKPDYTYVATVNENRGHECEKSQTEGLEGDKGSEKLSNYIILSEIEEIIEGTSLKT